MKTVDRYLCVHFLTSLLGVLFIVAVVLIITEAANIYGDILKGNPDLKWIVAYLALALPRSLAEVVPLATAVAVLWTLMKLSRQNELMALFCGGMSPARVSAPFLALGLVLSVGLFLLNEMVLHRTAEISNYIFRVQIRDEGQTYLSRGSRIYRKGAGRRFYSMDRFDSENREMTRPTLVVLDEDTWAPVLRVEADKAWPVGSEDSRLWRFSDAYVWRYAPDNTEIPVSMEHRDFIDLQMEKDLPTFLEQPGKAAYSTFAELWARVRALESGGHKAPGELTELHLKVAFPLAPLVVTLLVCSFAVHPRAGKVFVQFGSGIGLVLAYYVLTLILRKLGHRDVIFPVLAAWIPDLVFLILGGQWIVRNSGIR